MNAVINTTEALEASMAKAIAKTWLEPEFARKLIQNPTAALAEMGASVSSDVQIEVSQGAEAKWSLQQSGGRTVCNLTLVPCPTELNDTDEDLNEFSRTPAFAHNSILCCG